MAATNLFGNINIHPFEDENGKICLLILAHVLIQMKCCQFPVILSSFHRHGRRHYIRSVKMFDRKHWILYTMIVKSLVHCCDNFEQNAGILARCWGLISNTPIIGRHSHTDQRDLAETRNIIKMSSVMLLSFNVVELCVVTINEKLWTHAREVRRAVEYNEKAADIVKAFFSLENYTQKYQMGWFHRNGEACGLV